MHLPDFVLLVLGTFSAIAAGLGAAVLALENRSFKVVRVLFWASALSFGSMGVVWSQTSDGYSLQTQMIVAAVCAAIAAAGLVWGLHEVKIRVLPMDNHAAHPVAASTAIGGVMNNTGIVTQGQIGDNVQR